MPAPTESDRAVICLGDLMVDVLATLSGPLAPGSDSEAMITVEHGGSAANTAAWLAQLGVRTEFWGRVGADGYGSETTAALRDLGVAARVVTDDGRPTGTCIVLVTPDGERTMVPAAGANAGLTVDDVAGWPLRSQDHLHLSGYTLFRPGSRTAARFALDAAVRQGASVSVDASSARPLALVGPDEFLSWLPPSALLIANAEEANVLTGEREPAAAAQRLAAMFDRVVIKVGAAGAVAADAGGCRSVAGRLVPVLDTTGAGDAFAAGLLAALFDGLTLVEATARANRVAAGVVRRRGARPVPQEATW